MEPLKNNIDEAPGSSKTNSTVDISYRDLMSSDRSSEQSEVNRNTSVADQKSGSQNEPFVIDLSTDPYEQKTALPLTRDLLNENPALRVWQRWDTANGASFIKNVYEKASENQAIVDATLRNMTGPEHRRWRDFQLAIFEAPNENEAHSIRKQRDKAFPELTDTRERVRQYFDAGRHAEVDIKLLEAFPHLRDTIQFKKFLRTAHLGIKESLIQEMEKTHVDSSDFYGNRRNGFDLHNSDSDRPRLAFDTNKFNRSKVSPDTGYPLQGVRLGTTGDAILTGETEQSPEEYGRKLALTIHSAQAKSGASRFPLLPELDQFRSQPPLQFLEYKVRDDDLGRLKIKIQNPFKVHVQDRIKDIDSPSQTSVLSLRMERMEDNLAKSLNEKGSPQLMDTEKFKSTMCELRDSNRISVEAKSAFVGTLEQLIDPRIDGFVPIRDRHVLAAQIVEQFLNRQTIDQGDFGTCAMAGVEKLMYGHDLGRITRMITDVALTGKTTGANGREIAIDRDSLVGGSDLRRMVPPTDGIRSLASQYFALISSNFRFQLHNDVHRTQWRFVHEDGRDLVKDYSTNPPGNVFWNERTPIDYRSVAQDKREPVGYTPVSSPHIMELSTLLDTYEAMTGRSASGLAIEARNSYRGDPRAISVSSAREMHEQLAKLEKRDFPLIVIQPKHIATLEGYDQSSGRADFDNQWGDANDHFGVDGLTAEDVFEFVQGGSPYELRAGNILVSDHLETARDSELEAVPDWELHSRLAKATGDPTKTCDAIAAAKELKLRADQEASSGKRADSRSWIHSAQDALRKDGSIDGKDLNTEIARMSLCVGIGFHFGILSRQIKSRMVLGSISESAGLNGDAEKNYLEAKKLADELPLDLIEEQRQLLIREAARAKECKHWFEDWQPGLGDAKALPTKDGLVYQQLNVRMALLDFYCKGTEQNPEKAAKIATEIREKYLKMTGIDLIRLPDEPPPAMPREGAELQKMQHALGKKLRDAYRLKEEHKWY